MHKILNNRDRNLYLTITKSNLYFLVLFYSIIFVHSRFRNVHTKNISNNPKLREKIFSCISNLMKNHNKNNHTVRKTNESGKAKLACWLAYLHIHVLVKCYVSKFCY